MPTKPQPAKAKKPQIKVRDMKPKSDAKGGLTCRKAGKDQQEE